MQNKELQMFISAAFAGLLYYLGIVSIPIVMLVFAMIIDYITGKKIINRLKTTVDESEEKKND